jgi:hypothetical protein
VHEIKFKKLLGTLVCVCGAMIVSVFKGRLLHLWPTHLLRYSHASPASPSSGDGGVHHDGMPVVGTLFLCGSCLSYAEWFVVQVAIQPWNLYTCDDILRIILLVAQNQAKHAKVFPSKYPVTTLTCLRGSLQSFVWSASSSTSHGAVGEVGPAVSDCCLLGDKPKTHISVPNRSDCLRVTLIAFMSPAGRVQNGHPVRAHLVGDQLPRPDLPFDVQLSAPGHHHGHGPVLAPVKK